LKKYNDKYYLYIDRALKRNTHGDGVPKMPIQNAVTYIIIIIIIGILRKIHHNLLIIQRNQISNKYVYVISVHYEL